MEKQRQPSQSDNGVDYRQLYEALLADCGKANGERKFLLTKVAADISALLKIICEPDPPGCSGAIPPDDLASLLVACQKANADKKKQLQAIDHEIDTLMKKMCEPDPPGCSAFP
jgi:hypothetical protein